jgi:uncharacterized protein
MNIERLQARCAEFLEERMQADPAHDISHVRRVVKNTIYLTDIEHSNSIITVPSAWLHDCVSVPKDSPDRSIASRLAAETAVGFLEGAGYPGELLDEVFHAIEAHSYSAGIPPRTLEAKIVQDADRLEALGAIGIARCLLTGGSMGTSLYDPADPFCESREPDERQFTIDHFYQKLFRLPETMQTAAGKAEAHRRADYMRDFLRRLDSEITGEFDRD